VIDKERRAKGGGCPGHFGYKMGRGNLPQFLERDTCFFSHPPTPVGNYLGEEADAPFHADN